MVIVYLVASFLVSAVVVALGPFPASLIVAPFVASLAIAVLAAARFYLGEAVSALFAALSPAQEGVAD